MNRLFYSSILFLFICCSSTQTNDNLKNETNKNQIIVLKPQKNISHYLPKNFGYSFSQSYQIKIGVYFPFEQEINGILSGITLHVGKSIIYNLNEQSTVENNEDKYAPFRLNIYDFDTITKLPTIQRLKKDTLIKRDKKDKIIYVDFRKSKIPISKNGIFITLEKLTPQEYKKLGYANGPSFNIVGVSKKNSVIPYFLNQRYDNKWKVDKDFFNRNNTYDIAIIVSASNQ